LIGVELLGDFPYRDDASRAHNFSAILQPAVRTKIKGPTPLYSIEAPGPGVGKSLCAEVTTVPATGRTATPFAVPKDDDEMRKRLMSALLKDPDYVWMDNVSRPIDSPALASALTAHPRWGDRNLGVLAEIEVEMRASWLLTANNPKASGEVVRRKAPIL